MTKRGPIETRYRGYRFRSRLEARWAVFFDTLGVKWEYEPQGFHLPERSYLPDFFLPEWGVWAEVKATVLDFDVRLLTQLVHSTGKRAIALVGTPEIRWYPFINAMDFWPVTEWEDDETPPHWQGWINLGASARDKQVVLSERISGWYPDERPTDDGLFAAAVTAARSARFEHGESGPG